MLGFRIGASFEDDLVFSTAIERLALGIEYLYKTPRTVRFCLL